MTNSAVKNVPLGTPLEVRARLMTLGWPNLTVWAHAHGHKPVTVYSVIKMWAHRSDRVPHGGLSRAVVRDLRATMDQGITPADVLPSVEAAPKSATAERRAQERRDHERRSVLGAST